VVIDNFAQPPEHFRAAVYCASAVIRDRQLRGQPVHDWLRRHLARCEAAVAMSRSGQEFEGAPSQLDDLEDLIDVRKVASMLGISKRQAQRLGRDLDGVRIGGRWVFRKATVREYMEAKR
jgi:Helix-turn-helix domain